MTFIKPRDNDAAIDFPKGGKVYFTVDNPPKPHPNDVQSNYFVRLISPVGNIFYVPPHWHLHTTEFFRVLTGTAYVTIDGTKYTVTPESGERKIPAGSVHSIDVPEDQHVELMERVDPNPLKKAKFLYRLLNNDGRGPEAAPVAGLEALTIFYQNGDDYPSTGVRMVDKAMVYIGGGCIGTWLGYGKGKPQKP